MSRAGLRATWGMAAVLLFAPAVVSAMAPTVASADAPAADDTAADAVLAAIDGLIARPALLRGRFEQEKQLHGFRNPLRSRGRLLLVRDRGLVWDTLEPFPASTVLSRGRLVGTLPDGSRQVLFDAAQTPALAVVNSLLLALVAGDLPALSAQFDLAGTLTGDGGWTLRLTPREPALARVLTTVEMQGDAYVRLVRIAEAGGHRSTIRFLDLAQSPAASAQEAARLD